MQPRLEATMADFVPALRFLSPDRVDRHLGHPDLPPAWWTSVPIARAVDAIGARELPDRLAGLALDDLRHLRLGDLLPAAWLARNDFRLSEWPDGARTNVLVRTPDWADLLGSTVEDIGNWTQVGTSTVRPVISQLFAEVLGLLPAERAAAAGEPEPQEPPGAPEPEAAAPAAPEPAPEPAPPSPPRGIRIRKDPSLVTPPLTEPPAPEPVGAVEPSAEPAPLASLPADLPADDLDLLDAIEDELRPVRLPAPPTGDLSAVVRWLAEEAPDVPLMSELARVTLETVAVVGIEGAPADVRAALLRLTGLVPETLLPEGLDVSEDAFAVDGADLEDPYDAPEMTAILGAVPPAPESAPEPAPEPAPPASFVGPDDVTMLVPGTATPPPPPGADDLTMLAPPATPPWDTPEDEGADEPGHEREHRHEPGDEDATPDAPPAHAVDAFGEIPPATRDDLPAAPRPEPESPAESVDAFGEIPPATRDDLPVMRTDRRVPDAEPTAFQPAHPEDDSAPADRQADVPSWVRGATDKPADQPRPALDPDAAATVDLGTHPDAAVTVDLGAGPDTGARKAATERADAIRAEAVARAEAARTARAHPTEPHQAEAHQPDAHKAEAHQAEAHRAEAHQPDAHKAEAHQAEAHRAEAHRPDLPAASQAETALAHPDIVIPPRPTAPPPIPPRPTEAPPSPAGAEALPLPEGPRFPDPDQAAPWPVDPGVTEIVPAAARHEAPSDATPEHAADREPSADAPPPGNLVMVLASWFTGREPRWRTLARDRLFTDSPRDIASLAAEFGKDTAEVEALEDALRRHLEDRLAEPGGVGVREHLHYVRTELGPVSTVAELRDLDARHTASVPGLGVQVWQVLRGMLALNTSADGWLTAGAPGELESRTSEIVGDACERHGSVPLSGLEPPLSALGVRPELREAWVSRLDGFEVVAGVVRPWAPEDSGPVPAATAETVRAEEFPEIPDFPRHDDAPQHAHADAAPHSAPEPVRIPVAVSGDPGNAARCFRDEDGVWWYRVDVDAGLLEGERLPLPAEFVAALGLLPGESLRLHHAAGPAALRWEDEAYCVSLRAVLAGLGAEAGDMVFIGSARPGRLETRLLAGDGKLRLPRWARALRHTGVDPVPDQVNLPALLGSRLGLADGCDLKAVLKRLQDRGDTDVLELLGVAPAR